MCTPEGSDELVTTNNAQRLPPDQKGGLHIERFCYADDGTFGRMSVAGFTLYTVEQPWRNNERRVSCIPEGVYQCVPSFYNRGGYDCIEITGVPGRSRILFHKANWPRQLMGCIAPVSDWVCVNDEIGGSNSGRAFAMLMEHHGAQPFELEITQFLPDM